MINWYSNSRPSGCLGSVKLTKCADGQVNITFYDEVWKLVSKTKFVVFGVDGNKIYFKEDIKGRGYKLTCFRSNNQTCTLKVPQKKLPITNREEGDYHLDYDKELDLYYVDVSKRLTISTGIVFQHK